MKKTGIKIKAKPEVGPSRAIRDEKLGPTPQEVKKPPDKKKTTSQIKKDVTVNEVKATDNKKLKINKTTVVTKSQPSKTTQPISLRKPTSNVKVPVNSKREPLRASHEAVKKNSRPGIMPMVHNVTVSSPPVKRKDIQPQEIFEDSVVKSNNVTPKSPIKMDNYVPRVRTQTRTLDPDEVLVLNKEQDSNSVKTENDGINKQHPTKVKEPVAFEIKFADAVKPHETNSDTEMSVENSYADDFESYESDFESETSSDNETSAGTDVKNNLSLTENVNNEIQIENINKIESLINENISVDINESIPVTEDTIEKKMDSGNFESKSKIVSLIHNENSSPSSSEFLNSPRVMDDAFSSIEVVSKADSGFGSRTATTKKYEKKELYSQRGKDLLSKITIDVMNYEIFAQKPIEYEYYIRIYGASNMTEASFQIKPYEQRDDDTQTDSIRYRNSSTQYPPSFKNYKQFTSYLSDTYELNFFPKIVERNELDESLNQIQKIVHRKCDSMDNCNHVDYNKLNEFLWNSNLTISHIIEKEIKESNKDRILKSALPISAGYEQFKINHDRLKDSIVSAIYANIKVKNIFATKHQWIDSSNELYSPFTDIIAVWNINNEKYPICLLGSYTLVTSFWISSQFPTVFIGGCWDGSILLWTLNDNRHSTDTEVISPTQIIMSQNFQEDSGSVIAINEVINVSQQNIEVENVISQEIVSLTDSGSLCIWSIEYREQFTISTEFNDEMGFCSPYTRYSISLFKDINLNDIVKKQLKQKNKHVEDKVKMFERLCDDKALSEIAGMETDLRQRQLTVFVCNCLDMTVNGAYIGFNKNCLLFVPYPFASSQYNVEWINIGDDPMIFVTSIKYLDDYDILLVGLSNGSVQALPKGKQKHEENINWQNNYEPITEHGALNLMTKCCTIQNLIESERFDTKELTSFEFKQSGTEKSNNVHHTNQNYSKTELNQTKIMWDRTILHEFTEHLNSVNNISVCNNRYIIVKSLLDLRIYDIDTRTEISSTDFQNTGYHLQRMFDDSNERLLIHSNNELQIHFLN